MASAQKISELTTAGPLTGAELVPIVQSGGTLQTTVSVMAAFAVVSLVPVVSALATQIANVSAEIGTVTSVVNELANDVAALDVRVANVSALTSANTAAITSTNAVVSSLDVRVSVLEAAVSAIGDVSVIAGLVSVVTILDADVSALEIRVAAVSALTSVNTAAITSVNAVVSTKVNRVGDFMDNVQYIEFDTSTVQTVSVGRLAWDIEYGTLDIGLSGGNANVLVGQREVMYIYNDSGVTLPKGKVVEVTGASGQRLTVKLAQADSDANSATVLGVMLETVSVNNSGYVATNGIVRNVDTGAFTDGQLVYLSPVSAGELTPTKPVAPQHMVLIGYVVKGNSVGAGSIYVKTQNGYELGELHDVKTSASTSLTDGEVLAWNTSASVWTNSPALINVQASVSALNIQVAAVSVSVGQRVLKAGDSMTGELNMQDNLVTRPKVKDYSLQLVARGSVSTTTTLDLVEGNFFTAQVAGSTTFVFANPPVSTVATGGAAGGFVLELQNGGAATVTWPATVDWPGGTAPTLTASGFDIVVCITDDGGTNWRCVQSMKDSR